MRITVLGKSPSWQDAGGACSGYLVQQDDYCLLVDCGNGVFGKLRSVVDYARVDAVIVSHLHADHFLDLLPFSCALTYAPRMQSPPGAAARPALHAPPGAAATLDAIAAAAGLPGIVTRAFAVHEYALGDALQLGPLHVRLQSVPHWVQTSAVEIRDPAGARFTFGADGAPSAALEAFAAGTDLLMVEATLARPEDGDVRGHMTPSEAGRSGARAGATRLVLTHYSDELDAAWALREARATFGAGPVDLAAEGSVFEL